MQTSAKAEKQSYSTPATPTQVTPQNQQLFLEQLKEAKLKAAEEAKKDEKETKSPDTSIRRAGSTQGSLASSDRGSVSSDKVPQTSSGVQERERKRSDDGFHYATAVVSQPVVLQSHLPYQVGSSYRNNNLLKAELSLDEDTTSAISQTSSTSGK